MCHKIEDQKWTYVEQEQSNTLYTSTTINQAQVSWGQKSSQPEKDQSFDLGNLLHFIERSKWLNFYKQGGRGTVTEQNTKGITMGWLYGLLVFLYQTSLTSFFRKNFPFGTANFVIVYKIFILNVLESVLLCFTV